jgi:hypothetical protein
MGELIPWIVTAISSLLIGLPSLYVCLRAVTQPSEHGSKVQFRIAILGIFHLELGRETPALRDATENIVGEAPQKKLPPPPSAKPSKRRRRKHRSREVRR